MSNNSDRILLPWQNTQVSHRPLCRTRRVMTAPPLKLLPLWFSDIIILTPFLGVLSGLPELEDFEPSFNWQLSLSHSFPAQITWLNLSYETDQLHPCATLSHHAACEGASSGSSVSLTRPLYGAFLNMKTGFCSINRLSSATSTQPDTHCIMAEVQPIWGFICLFFTGFVFCLFVFNLAFLHDVINDLFEAGTLHHSFCNMQNTTI